MDFEKYGELPILSEIPLSIRNIFYQTFKFQPLRQLGAGYYTLASKKIASVFQSSVASGKVFLLNPQENVENLGAFDLEFLISKEREFKEKEVWDLRADYFELKRKFPVLGRVSLTQSSVFKEFLATNFASTLYFNQRKKFSDGKWKIPKKVKEPNFDLLSRLALAIRCYGLAQHYLLQSHSEKLGVFRAKFYQEAHRALYLASGEKTESFEVQSPAFLLAHVFFQIHHLSDLCLKQGVRRSDEFEVHFLSKSGNRFSAEMLNRSWIDKLKKIDNGFAAFRATSSEGVITPTHELNLVTVVNLFSSLVNYLPSLLGNKEELPLLLPANAFELMALGWHWDESLIHLSWSYPSQNEDLKWLTECGSSTYWQLKERVSLERNLILGSLVSESPQAVEKRLKIWTRNLLHLKLKSNDLEDLSQCPQRDLTQTKKAWTVLNQKNPVLNLKDLLELTLNILREVSLEADLA